MMPKQNRGESIPSVESGRTAISFFRFIFALAGVALAGGCATSIVQAPPAEEVRGVQSAAILERVKASGRSGDWLVIRGYHNTDHLVAAATNSPFTHAAVLDLERGEVIEAEAQGVHTSKLADFVHKAHRLLVIRPAWSDARSGPLALDSARLLVGKKYDFLGTVGLGHPDRYYCTELAVAVYRPFMRDKVVLPPVIEPGQLYYWGKVIYDSGSRDYY